MKAIDLQLEIFDRIRKNLGGKKVMNEWLQAHFGIGQAGVYRRLNGTTLLDLEELLSLIKAFRLPTYELFENPEALLYFYLDNAAPTDYEAWMTRLHQDFTQLTGQSNVTMYYTSTENPVFYYFHFKELLHFKLYNWAKTIWEIPILEKEAFDLENELWTETVESYRQNILRSYTNIPSVELWTPNLMNNNLNQIQYYLESFQFADRYDALLLCDQLSEMLRLIQEQLKTGCKKAVLGMSEDKTANFALYYNEILHTNNTVLFTADEGQTLFNTFGNPNTIRTQQQSTCAYTFDWFQKLMKRSIHVNSASEREQLRLFKKMEQKVLKAERLFKGML